MEGEGGRKGEEDRGGRRGKWGKGKGRERRGEWGEGREEWGKGRGGRKGMKEGGKEVHREWMVVVVRDTGERTGSHRSKRPLSTPTYSTYSFLFASVTSKSAPPGLRLISLTCKWKLEHVNGSWNRHKARDLILCIDTHVQYKRT